MNTQSEDKSGFEPDLGCKEQCRDPHHHAPTMLYVPPGQRYRNVCPTCGHVEYINGPQASLQSGHDNATELH